MYLLNYFYLGDDIQTATCYAEMSQQLGTWCLRFVITLMVEGRLADGGVYEAISGGAGKAVHFLQRCFLHHK